MRCTVCGRPPAETCCHICHRVASAVARLAEAVGYEETAKEMRELIEGTDWPEPDDPMWMLDSRAQSEESLQ